jgi:branched-chain amino acid transport system permease protein
MRYAAEAVPWLLALGCYWLFPDYLGLFAQVWIAALFALSLDLLVGYAGVVTLGHAAFFGLGAYVAGILAVQGWGEPFSGLLLAGLAAALLGLLSAPLVLRGSELAGLMITLGLALMLYEAANKATFLTGGADGLQGVEIWPLFGRFRFDLYGRTAFLYALGVLFVAFMALRFLVATPFGLALRGIRGNALRMAAMGTPVRRRLVAAYAVSAGVAGLAGAVLAQTAQFVSLDVLAFQRSAEGLLMLLIGGLGALYGAVLGAAAFTLAHHLLAEMTPQFWEFWIGAAMVLLVMLGRGGMLGLLRRLGR